MADAHFIWTDDTAEGRNRHALFRRTFELDQPGAVESAVFHLFADSRYRLIVNGQTLPHGPARFYPEHPPYDTHDLKPYLQAGRNVIAVLVVSFGSCRNYQAEPGPGGLLAWGAIESGDSGSINLKSGTDWKAIDAPAFDMQTPKMSFALNPAEILDARQLPANWDEPDFDDAAWPAATLLANQAHWGEPEPRPIEFLDESTVRPLSLTGVFAAGLSPDEVVHSARIVAAAESGRNRGMGAVFAWIHSPREQEVTIGGWWGEHWVNGEKLHGREVEGMKYRLNRTARLNAGWNRYVMHQEMRSDILPFYLSLPKSAGLTLCAEQDLQCEAGFLTIGWDHDQANIATDLPWPLAAPEDLPAELGSWTPQPRGNNANLPFNDRAWKNFRKIADAMPVDDLDIPALREKLQPHENLVLAYDFEREILGRPRLELTAEEGAFVDLGYSERLNEHGLPSIAYRFHVEMSERLITREGRQSWHLLHPRGFRYLEVTLPGTGEFTLHDLDITQFIYPTPQQEGEFRCSDPLLEKIWRAGTEALRVNKEDVYMDCPHRERGLYVGDSLVEFMADRAAFGDTDIFRRSLALYWHGQGPNGLVKPAAHHNSQHGTHPDYSALMPQLLWTWWEATGDLDLVRLYKEPLKRLVEGLLVLRDENGVYSDCGKNSYIDVARTARTGPTCVLNCFVKEAFSAAARLLPMLGEPDEAARWQTEADALAEIIRKNFFDPEAGLFLDFPHEYDHDFSFSVHGNTLAVLYGIAEEPRVEHIINWLCGELRANFIQPNPVGAKDVHVNAYFSYYVLETVLQHNRMPEVLAFIRHCWGHMIKSGAWTTWEYFFDNGGDSLCHAWAAAPTWFLTQRVLGVQFPEPGNPDVVLIAPQTGGLTWAEGIYPHPRGPIKVRWERKELKINITWEGPDGVDIRRG